MAPNLERLQCIETPLKGETMACLTRKLQRGDWHKLEFICFTDGGLDDLDVMPLASAMRRSPHQYISLRVLNLNCNMLTVSSITALAHMLQEGNCPGLMDLNVADNPIGDAGVSALMKAIQGGAPCNATLEYIGLQGCDIGWERGARVYLEAWADGWMPTLVNHNLGGNPIGLDGIRALCRMYAVGRLQRKHILQVDIWGHIGIDVFVDVIRQEQAHGLLLVDPGDQGGYFYELLKGGLAVLGKERLLIR
jgi:Ran GTPase-activating protein (RanGAP) involved in mRNA processing and transport